MMMTCAEDAFHWYW